MRTNPMSSDTVSAGRYLTFRLGAEAYGIEVLAVQEIIRSTTVTMVPQLPSHLRGVINLRGRIVPVVDLRRRFGLPAEAEGDRACIIVVQFRSAARGIVPIGLLVDTVEEVMSISEAEISPPPDFGCTVNVAFLRGLARVHGMVKALLDIDRVLTGEQLSDAVSAAA